jgi:ParB family transcriptional regulator, chromosome partitioning protein
MSTRKEALGKGLGALLSSHPVKLPLKPGFQSGKDIKLARIENPAMSNQSSSAGQICLIGVESIQPNPFQPRKVFSEESLEELSNSIQEHGILQPLLVTENKTGTGYLLVAGERRFRASQKAGLTEVPAIIQDVNEEEMLEIAIVENVQRDDLNCVEEARAYRSLISHFGWSQEQVAQRVGKRRSTVANSLRLLRLGEDALADLEEGRMTAGHARAILSLEDAFYRQKLRQEVVEKNLSVREAEKRAQAYQKTGSPTHRGEKKSEEKPVENLDTVALEEQLMAHLGCRVKIKTKDGRSGVLEVPFGNPDELERFLQAIEFQP